MYSKLSSLKESGDLTVIYLSFKKDKQRWKHMILSCQKLDVDK